MRAAELWSLLDAILVSCGLIGFGTVDVIGGVLVVSSAFLWAGLYVG